MLNTVAAFLRVTLDPIAMRFAQQNLRGIYPSLTPTSPRMQRIYQDIQREFSPPLEPFLSHFPSETLLLGFWLVSYESFASPALSRSDKEHLAIAVSDQNSCEFCRVAHTLMLEASVGCVTNGASPALFSAEANAERIAIIRVFEYINRMMLVFTRKPNAFMFGTGSLYGRLMGNMVTLRVGPEARRQHEPGQSFRLLDATAPIVDPIAGGFEWAASRPHVERAFRQWHAFQQDAEKRLPLSLQTKIALRHLGANETLESNVPATEARVVSFAETLIHNPAAPDLTSKAQQARTFFNSDTAWVEFVSWCSYLATEPIVDASARVCSER